MSARLRQLTPINPPSLSILEPALTRSTPEDGTQLPTTPIEDTLPRYGISKELAKEWNRTYNHASIQRIHEHFFYDLLIEVASEMNPADEEFESELESRVERIMEERNEQSHEKFDDIAYDLIGEGFKLFEDKDLTRDWFLSFRNPHAIHNLEAFFSNCLPVLIKELKELREYKAKGRKRSSTGTTRKNSPKVKKPSSESSGRTGTRRSSRTKKSPTPAS